MKKKCACVLQSCVCDSCVTDVRANSVEYVCISIGGERMAGGRADGGTRVQSQKQKPRTKIGKQSAFTKTHADDSEQNYCKAKADVQRAANPALLSKFHGA